ncbi:adenosinetriphosphatase [Cladophialophora psammophila CBS 110553]|uniref:DNA helicase n=1 Tax=Cladophialophora psammophila CBS 110553 TaxID=1182543 RepID=W9WKT8_9EURO|nr:adenosinetriphosphatase [Cladophialophora psammophila CBS 110553]EXJ65610.1 adenosinetriphosphatase [Cladophialophora psammophila CBS 110553]
MPIPSPTGDFQSDSNTQHQDLLNKRSTSPIRNQESPVRSSVDPHDGHDGPPAKRRKVAGTDHKSSPRLISPPWKRVVAEGPASFIQDGRRKSGRTNIVPLDLQPQSNKRQTRAAFDKAKEERQKHAKPVYNVSARKSKIEAHVSPPVTVKRGPVPPSKGHDVSQSQHHRKAEASQRHLRDTILISKHPHLTQPKSPRHRTSAHRDTVITSTHPHSTQPKSPRHRASAAHRPQTTPPRLSVAYGDKPQTNGIVKIEQESDDDNLDTSSGLSSRGSTPPVTLRKVTFRVRLPPPSVASPANVPLPKKYASFEEFLEKDETEPRTGEETLTRDQVEKEAVARQRVKDAQKRGSLHNKFVDALPDKQDEPGRQYAHRDHLLAHVCHFRNLLRAEHREHKRKAEILAHEAKRYVEKKQKRNKVKTAEEIEQEKREACVAIYRTVVKDIDKLWAAVRQEVNAIRQKEYEEQQQAKMKGHLARVLDRTDQMLTRLAEQDDSMMDSETDLSSNETTESESENSEQMSESETETESEPDDGDHDAQMSIEELKKKYGNLPDLPIAHEGPFSDGKAEDEESLDQPDAESDPETEMDSEFDTSGSGDEDEGEEGESEEDETGGGLLSMLFSKKQIVDMTLEADEMDASKKEESESRNNLLVQVLEDVPIPKAEPSEADRTPVQNGQEKLKAEATSEHSVQLEAPTAQETDNAGLRDATPLIHSQIARLPSEDPGSQEHSSHPSPHTTTTKFSEPGSLSSIDVRTGSVPPVTPSEAKSVIKTPVPSLLRGTLREYQHEGLDWLADLYAHGRSGILADEMGLGKTIQSIALLAHLAEVYEVWGPHLIVVPTSVMLNWEMEFKKFLPGFKVLTYYGNLEERKQKRRGWMADDSFNVCITSYQLVLQDANSFKRRKWHYMILDEAHNIKNFRSERWQTMMTFNTRARLLLTGTPLQNNLTELWSLLFFLHYGQENEGEDDAFAGLKEWSEWFKRPVESILEHGRQALDEEDREQVAKLHKVIRPFLLRRLKADVEKQMPAKYEHVEMCRLSKRQRQLYDGFMSRAQTKETLASGNYLSIINALMQLRKVCNHPDLFETRPINTSFAMHKSAAADFEIKDFLVRRRLMLDASNNLDLDFLRLVPISEERLSMIEVIETTKRHAYNQLRDLREAQSRRVLSSSRNSIHNDNATSWRGETRRGVLGSLENVGRRARLQELDRTMYYEAYKHHQHPIYGCGLIDQLTINTTYERLSKLSPRRVLSRLWDEDQPMRSLNLIHSVQSRSGQMQPFVDKYACVTPAVVATDLYARTVTEAGAQAIREAAESTLKRDDEDDPFHLARMKLSIAFPDKRLLQYDCGKLQRLDKLLRQLQAGSHRALIFTQMTKVLDILEQFLNIHGHRYLRLDGATKIEQRQILTERFNNDTRILCFILSSRSGGLGINLTGADTVIFYDLDWNPAMDKQCTDRAHRIGQTRDVHIYRFVSEHTIESNILRKANQKQMLDDVVIQEGDFTTDYMNRMTYRDMLDENAEEDEAGKAMDRVLGNENSSIKELEQAEDQEDRVAAKVAARELQHADEGDFEDGRASATPRTQTGDARSTPASGVVPGEPFGATDTAITQPQDEEERIHHIDEYLIQLQRYLMKDIPLGPGKDSKKGKKGRRGRDEHRVRRVR